ncbi:MAG: arginine--tRNA ligase [Chloroflexota bacterium]|nr:arginine--tRNA ligase [Chloroflexota bacterium]MDE2908113.1 arginine--tRNA ligase [Chloroflexota bacterium]
MKLLHRELELAIEAAIKAAQASGELPQFGIPPIPVSAPKRTGQGDLAYPAMGLAKLARMKPLDIARLIGDKLPELDFADDIRVAPPGFINCSIAKDYLARQVDAIIAEGDVLFQLGIGCGKRAQVEFVSANPSGPITIGHTRGAVVGDAMARLLEAAGYSVQREYYYNNAGSQMVKLGKSLMLRYREQLGDEVKFPAEYYQGEYLVEVAADLVAEQGDSLRGEGWEYFRDAAETRMFDWIERSLASIDIRHDAFFNESSLFESGKIWAVLETMRESGHIYEAAYWEGAGEDEIADVESKGYAPATWFRSSAFGDEKDRVMVKSDGVPTYTLPDITYHCDKLERGFDIAVNVLGTDHFSQAQVVRHGIEALGMDPEPIHVIFNQMVRAVRRNEETGEYEAVKQSKRAGDFDTLDDLVEMTSADAVRYHMLARSPNSQLDFDVDQVVKQTNENPVYYIQNAYVRCAGIFREAEERGFDDAGANLALLGEDELAFIGKALELGNVIEQAVVTYEPHKIAFFAQELASVFHPIYDRVRVLHSEVPRETAKARLRFYRAAAVVFQRVLRLMGMSAPERM